MTRAGAFAVTWLALAPFGAGQEELVCMVEESTLDTWETLEGLAADFGREHGVDVRLIALGGAAGAQDKGRFLLAGDLQLDVLRIDVTELAAFRGEGAIVDLQPFFDADPAWNAEEYFDVALDALRDEHGHLYGLPSTFTPYVMYANLDLLEQAGVARPAPDWSWEDFRSACERTTRDTDGDGLTDLFGVSLTQWMQAVSPWIWQNGGAFFRENGERADMGSPEFVGALRFLQTLLHEDRVASFDASFQNQLSQGLFQAGRAAFYGPVGYWETFRFRHIEDFRWDVLPLPRGREAATAIAMTVYVVPRTSRRPELAYRFLRLLASERYQRRMAEIGNGVPGLRSAAYSESFLKPDVAPESEHVFLDVLEHARFPAAATNLRQVESLCRSDLEGVLLVEGTDVEAACRSMQERTDAFLARERLRKGRPRLPEYVLPAGLALSVVVPVLLALLLRIGRLPRPLRAERRAASTMLAPWFAGFLLFLLLPAVFTVVLAASEWSPLRDLDDVRYVEAENVLRLLEDPTFAASLRATLLYALVSVPLGLALAFGIALLLRPTSLLSSTVRTLCYLPAVLSPVVVACLWGPMLDPDTGVTRALFGFFGLESPAWFREPAWVLPAFVTMSLWSVGAQMLVFLAAMSSLDPTLEEAARLDGAGRWQRVRHVLVPQLSPVILFNLVIGTINGFQVFAQPFLLTQGGPRDASRFLVLYLYETAFRHLDTGYAAAIALALAAALGVLCAGILGTSRKWVHYGGG